jgi:hypothetical protein
MGIGNGNGSLMMAILDDVCMDFYCTKLVAIFFQSHIGMWTGNGKSLLNSPM